MSKKGLTHEMIINTALELINEHGYDQFSLRELALKLNVKPASLYNHVHGLNEINIEVAFRVSQKLNTLLSHAIDGKDKDQAFMDAVKVYRQFALDYPGEYAALIKMPKSNDENIIHAGLESFAPLRNLIKSYHASHDDTIHFIRALRSTMHGFVELTHNGFMQRGSISRDESYEIVMKNYLKKLKEMAHNE